MITSNSLTFTSKIKIRIKNDGDLKSLMILNTCILTAVIFNHDPYYFHNSNCLKTYTAVERIRAIAITNRSWPLF